MESLAVHMESAARKLLGEPNSVLSSKAELRYGAHGSLAVDLEKGTYFDHEAGEGGGVLDLVARVTGQKDGLAVDYLRKELGVDIPDGRGSSPRATTKAPRVAKATYDYHDEAGELLFQVVRMEPKDFRQRRPDPSTRDGWNWSVKGVRQVPYRLPELIEAIGLGKTIYIPEGEKDVDALRSSGLTATCNAGGAGKWPAELSAFFDGADVVILPDNDDAGRNHASVVGAALEGVARSVKVLPLPGLPLKGDVSDWLAKGGDAADLPELADTIGTAWTPAPPVSRFGAILWSEIDSVEIRQDWLVEDMLFCGDFALSYGAASSGKSFLALDMALSIARGVPFLGKATRRGAAIYQAGEGGKGLVKRQKAYRLNRCVSGDVPFVLLPNRLDLFAPDAENGIEPFLEEVLAFKAWLAEPLALVVIDTFSTATPGANENASEDVSRALKNIQRIQETAKCAVLVVHHKNAGGEKPRGHTSLYANADTALEVSRSDENPDERTLRVAKVKDGEDGEELGFQLQSVTIGAYDDGKPITSCVVVPAQAGEPRTGEGNGRKPITPAQRKFLKTLDDAILHDGEMLPKGPGTWNLRGVEWTHFQALYKATAVWPGQSDEAIRKAISRDGEALVTAGLVGRRSPYVWLTDRGRAYVGAMGV